MSNNDDLDDAIDKYLKYIAVFSSLFDMAECGWLNKFTRVSLVHKYGIKTANNIIKKNCYRQFNIKLL